MATITAAVWLLFVPIVALIGILLWATESRSTRIQRWRTNGQSWAAIGRRLGCSASTAKRWATAS